MTLQYTVTPEDYLQFNLYQYDHNKALQALVRALRLIAPGILVLLGVLFSGGDLGLLFFVMLGLAVLWILLLPWQVRRSLRRGLARQIRAGHYTDFVGAYTLELLANGIRETAPKGTYEHAWAAIQKVCEDKAHTYLYLGEESAIIVPHAAFADSAARDEFLSLVREGIAAGPAAR